VTKFDFIDAEMKRRRKHHQLRELSAVTPISAAAVTVSGRDVVNFCSNDYMGLSKDPRLQGRALAFMERYGTGSTASRLICGTYDCFVSVEEKLARLKGTESALILNSGFQANISIIPTLVDAESLIISDRLNHNSIIQGVQLSGCRRILYDHNNLDHLEQVLEENHDRGYSRILIVTESVFSADGDRSDIDGLNRLAEKYEALLIVDEAHATGVFGLRGMGLTAGKNVDVTIGTFGKALGSFGAYIACSKQIRDYLVNCCWGFIYTTALPPPVIGAIDAALDLIPGMEAERETLQDNAALLRDSLSQLGYNTGDSTTQIIPGIIGDEQETLALSERLGQSGFLAMPFRPPTVAPGQSRIRITLSAAHTREQVEGLIDVFRKWKL